MFFPDDHVTQSALQTIFEGCFGDVLVASEYCKEDGQVEKQIPSVAGTFDITPII